MKVEDSIYSRLFQDKKYLEFTRNQLFKDTEYFRQFSSFLSVKNGDIICDLGCGTGFLDFELINKYKTVKIFCLDNDEDYLEYAKHKAYSNNQNDLVFIKHDLNNPLPFDNDSFNIIYSFGAMHMVKNYNATIKECFRTLKKEGKLIIFLPIDECYQTVHENDISPNSSIIKELEDELFNDYRTFISDYITNNSGLHWSIAPQTLQDNKFINIQIFGMFTPFNPTNYSDTYPHYLKLMEEIDSSRATCIFNEFYSKARIDILETLKKQYKIKYEWKLNQYMQYCFHHNWGGAPLLITFGVKSI